MEPYQVKIIVTAVVILLYFAIKFISGQLVSKAGLKLDYQKPRIKIIKKINNLILFFVGGSVLMFIWGVNRSELFYFISSLLTVLGIAFIAQWSILSNITSTIIIFFNHPVKIGDHISILDKEYQIEGYISDIGVFFLHIRTDDGDNVTIPSNLFMQKMIKKSTPKRK